MAEPFSPVPKSGTLVIITVALSLTWLGIGYAAMTLFELLGICG